MKWTFVKALSSKIKYRVSYIYCNKHEFEEFDDLEDAKDFQEYLRLTKKFRKMLHYYDLSELKDGSILEQVLFNII